MSFVFSTVDSGGIFAASEVSSEDLSGRFPSLSSFPLFALYAICLTFFKQTNSPHHYPPPPSPPASTASSETSQAAPHDPTPRPSLVERSPAPVHSCLRFHHTAASSVLAKARLRKIARRKAVVVAARRGGRAGWRGCGIGRRIRGGSGWVIRGGREGCGRCLSTSVRRRYREEGNRTYFWVLSACPESGS